ncbi:MAG: RNA methyltransferase [Lentisphaerae bacterium]|jgi:tRNA/rRNA methyltransferase|nr:RNA methyltransferase [Lentisphaerota bacterium]
MAQKNIKVVLVAPLYGGNIGSACRAMSNTGVSELRLVTPDPDIDWAEAEKMAVHADELLKSRKTFGSIADAVADCVAVVGTTARRGLYRRHAKTPREWAGEIAALSEIGPVAIVFGREDSGLFNEEIQQCTHLMQIPSSSEYCSLNIAQAVMIVCYELFTAQGNFDPVKEKSELAPGKIRTRMTSFWREYLRDIEFMYDDTTEHMMAAINRIFSRGVLTKDDANIMMGIVRQSRWAIDNLAACKKQQENQEP